MKVTVILIVIGEFGTVTKGLVTVQDDLQIRGQVCFGLVGFMAYTPL